MLLCHNSSSFSPEVTRQERPLHSSTDTIGRGMGAQRPQWVRAAEMAPSHLFKQHWLHTVSELGIVIPHRLTWPSDKQNITLTILPFPLFPSTLFKQGEEHKHDNLFYDSLLRIMSTTLTLTQNSFKLPSLVQPWALLHLDWFPLLSNSLFPPAHLLLFQP